jgi:hypothetical protein
MRDVDDHQTWLQQLPADAGNRARQLILEFQQLGCDQPELWARSEIEEDIPQLARHRFLRTLWPQMIDSWRDGMAHIPAAKRALEAGASQEDLTVLARAIAYETAFLMLYHLDADHDATDQLPSWGLAELSPTGEPTGRRLEGLQEDLLTLDPSGADGQDLWS